MLQKVLTFQKPVLYIHFNKKQNPTKLFSNLYVAKFLDLS